MELNIWSFCCPLQSIMKNYDHNQDGYISLEEFEKIAANFPFSFCTQETDRWGSCSLHTSLLSWPKCKSEKGQLTYIYVALWKIFCLGRDKSAVKKSPLTSWGECPYVPSWGTTSMTHITSMKPHTNDQHSVIYVEALWVSLALFVVFCLFLFSCCFGFCRNLVKL